MPRIARIPEGSLSVERTSQLTKLLLLSLFFFAVIAVMRLADILPLPGERQGITFEPTGIHISFAGFEELDGWRRGYQHDALPAFLLSCARMATADPGDTNNPLEALGEQYSQAASLSGFIKDWRRPCQEAGELATRDFRDQIDEANAIRAFFESNFQPIEIQNRLRANTLKGGEVLRPEGVFTGYFEPVYDASSTKSEVFSAPVLRRPKSLVMASLGKFRDKHAGVRIAGSVVDGFLVPYPDRSEINAGALGREAKVIAWVRPNDLFFLQIQGSGRLRIFGDREIRVGYDGQNGHPYTAIGRLLVERGHMELSEASMQSIRSWLDSASDEDAKALREENKSYVFFRSLSQLPSEELGPLGAEGVQLTPRRSLAVDRRYFGMGLPIWMELDPDENGNGPQLRRLMVAQDTGGAIKGAVRGDIFAGAGSDAALFAGGLNSTGRMYALIPNTVAARLADEIE